MNTFGRCSNGKDHEISVAADGKLISNKIDDDDKDEKGEHEGDHKHEDKK